VRRCTLVVDFDDGWHLKYKAGKSRWYDALQSSGTTPRSGAGSPSPAAGIAPSIFSALGKIAHALGGARLADGRLRGA
jgi:hypothetical protein